ncbi:M28 family peptidase, partial [Candidatus Gottesmanbacteria bacterium]|nr:M28 family peptidase [Candidatus Gottesmanbacteria bacterium]
MKKRLLKTFLELIKINETSGQEKEIVDYVKKYLQKLDLKIKSDKFGNIIAQLPGVGKPLLLNTHLDIPEPMKNFDYKIKEDVILANGKSILGADPKSGLTVLLEFVRYIKDRKITTRPLEFVFTKSEEKGLVGAKNLDFSLLTAKEGLVLDENGPCTQVVVKAPSFCRVLIKITGKTAHVSEPEKGINALEIACNAISGLDLGYIRKG